MTGRTCSSCKYAMAPNAKGCLCTNGGCTTFHAGLEPCSDYKMADVWKALAKRRAGQ